MCIMLYIAFFKLIKGNDMADIFDIFKRLEQNGFITSYWGEDGPGARRRYYAITEEGRRRWEENCREWESTRALLDALITLEEV